MLFMFASKYIANVVQKEFISLDPVSLQLYSTLLIKLMRH